MPDIHIIDMQGHPGTCIICGAEIDCRHALACYEHYVVPDDWAGEWGGRPVCERCYKIGRDVQSQNPGRVIEIDRIIHAVELTGYGMEPLVELNKQTPEQAEYEAALRRAFVDGRADFVYADSRRQQFQINSINYGVDRGWLTARLNEIDEQYSRYEARLTEAGRTHFGLANG